MKEHGRAAKNYAQALLELAGDDLSSQELLLEEIKTINEFIKKLKGAKQVFENPSISKDEKKKLVQELKDKISRTTLNLLKVLIDKQRFYLLPEIQNQLNKFVNKKRGIVIAEVYSAHEIDQPMVTRIVETLRRNVSTTNDIKDIKIEQRIDSSLIGGLKVKINDRVYDGSIKCRLEGLKQKLL